MFFIRLFYANFSLGRFCAFLLELYCSHGEVKLVAEIKLLVAEWAACCRVGSALGYGAGDPSFESRRGQLFSSRLLFESNSSDISRFICSTT